jgi:hypothetical protein
MVRFLDFHQVVPDHWRTPSHRSAQRLLRIRDLISPRLRSISRAAVDRARGQVCRHGYNVTGRLGTMEPVDRTQQFASRPLPATSGRKVLICQQLSSLFARLS